MDKSGFRSELAMRAKQAYGRSNMSGPHGGDKKLSNKRTRQEIKTDLRQMELEDFLAEEMEEEGGE